MDQTELRNQLLEACRRAYTRGIQTNNGGNASVRIPGEDRMLIKSSGTSFVDGGAESYVVCDFDGNALEPGKPSREAKLHGFLYRELPEAGAIMHVHAPYAIALASLDVDFVPDVTFHSVLKLHGRVPIFRNATAAVQPGDFEMVKRALDAGDGKSAIIFAKHGVFAIADNIINAEHVAELIEETARIAILEKLLKTI